MAKKLSMIERAEKGRQARKYFIECEKKLLSAYREPETITVSKQNLTSLINDVLWLRQIFIESKLLESLRSIGADRLSDTLNSRIGNAMIGVKLLNYNDILFSQANPR